MLAVTLFLVVGKEIEVAFHLHHGGGKCYAGVVELSRARVGPARADCDSDVGAEEPAEDVVAGVGRVEFRRGIFMVTSARTCR